MKVTKMRLTEGKQYNRKLREAEEGGEPVVLDDPQDASVKEIEQAILASSESRETGEPTISAETAKELAQDTKKISYAIDSTGDYLDIICTANKKYGYDNALIRELNKSLKSTVRNYRLAAGTYERGQAAPPKGSNLIITGLPGSAKTAIVKDWCKTQQVFGKPLKCVYLDVKTNEISAALSGIVMNTTRVGDARPTAGKAYTYQDTANLKELDSNKAYYVLFLDEFNRQLDKGIRGSLLTLIKDKAVEGEEPDSDTESGFHYFKNLLFVVIACNPKNRADKGADDLTTPEMDRGRHVEHNSTVALAQDYYDKTYLSAAAQVDPAGPYYANKVADNLRMHDVGHFIVNDPLFTTYGGSRPEGLFTTRAEYDDFEPGKQDVFSIRGLDEMVSECGGYKDEIMEWLDKNSSLWQSHVVKVLKQIMNSYEELSDAELIAKYKNELPQVVDGKVIQPEETSSASNSEGSVGDEEDFSANEDSVNIFKNAVNAQNAAKNGTTVASVNGAKQIVNDAFDGITF